MKALNQAFKHESGSIIKEQNFDSFGCMDRQAQEKIYNASSAISDKYAENFIKSYKTNENVDYSKKTKDLLRETFPAETTSLYYFQKYLLF